MPLVPLYDEFAPPGSSHHIRSPGGYETWRIIAYDANQELLLFAALHQGCLADPSYIKAYRRYLRRPTRVAPPLPQDYAAEEFALYHHGRRILKSFIRLPQPISAKFGNELRVGESTLSQKPIGAPSSLNETTLNSSHRWMMNNPLAQLHGQFNQFTFDALAVRDHRYGTSPLNVTMWLDGVIFFPGSALLFQATPTTSWIIEVTPDGMKVIDEPLSIDSIPSLPIKARMPQVTYPATISIGERAVLTQGLLIDRHRKHILYRAKSHGESGRGLCELSYPKRLNWPLAELFAPRPRPGLPLITWSPLPPADKSSPSDPGHARAPSSSP